MLSIIIFIITHHSHYEFGSKQEFLTFIFMMISSLYSCFYSVYFTLKYFGEYSDKFNKKEIPFLFMFGICVLYLLRISYEFYQSLPE